MFPNSPLPGADFTFTETRKPRSVTKEFVRKATALGFPRLRFHDLRGTHEEACGSAHRSFSARGNGWCPSQRRYNYAHWYAYQ